MSLVKTAPATCAVPKGSSARNIPDTAAMIPDPQASVRSSGRSVLNHALKRCPLCEAVVVADATACFVCDWRGTFLHDEEIVAHSVDSLLERCPELVEAMIEEVQSRTTVWERLRRSLAQSAAKVFTVGIDPPLSHSALPPLT